jgi:hypothetical protein
MFLRLRYEKLHSLQILLKHLNKYLNRKYHVVGLLSKVFLQRQMKAITGASEGPFVGIHVIDFPQCPRRYPWLNQR